MGVDVNLYAEGVVTDQELAEAEKYMEARCSYMRWRDDQDTGLLERSRFEPNRIEVSTGVRYYGPGYERGSWPQIYGAIAALRAALPNCKVFYGGDTTDDGIEATDEYLASIWRHWLGPHGDDYHGGRTTVKGDSDG